MTNQLTTKERVKARLTISGTSFDTLLDRLVSSVSSFIKGEIHRELKEADYVEMYSIYQSKRNLMLNQYPVSAISKVEYRRGSYSDPDWTEYSRDEYELDGDGKAGILGLAFMAVGINKIRVSYTAGYKIDFTKETDITKHNLPEEISDLCERLVVKWFRKRDSWGKTSEGSQGDSVSWKNELEEEDRRVISRYKKPSSF